MRTVTGQVASTVPHRVRRRRSWALAGGGVLLVLLAGGYAGISLRAADVLSTAGTHKPLTAAPTSIGSTWEDVSFRSRTDGIVLRGWLVHAPVSEGRSAILLHGFQANRTDAGCDLPGIARAFVDRGFDTLVFDFRSFGLSDGATFTLGWKEGRDVLGAYDFMKGRGYDPALMAILGVSMGAESMLGVAEDLSDVGALIADSAYADLRPILDRNITEYSGLPAIFNPGIILAFQLFHGANADFRPVDHVRAAASRAFLFMHGGADTFIPPVDSRALKAASANPESELVIFDGSEHSQEFTDQSQRYLAIVFAFIDRQLAGHRSERPATPRFA